MSDRSKKINNLERNLRKLNLSKESRELKELNILKIAIMADENVGSRAYWNYKTPEERKKIDFKKIEEQSSELTHHVLDVIGLIPGPGDVADFISAVKYTSEGKYELAAISLLCLIPLVGTAIGIAKKSGVMLSAKIVFEHADEIEEIVKVYEKQVPNGEKVSEAVRKILSEIRMGADGIDLTTGFTVKTTGKAAEVSIEGAIKSAPSAAKWYLNPRWKEWFSSLIQPNLIKILNQVSEKEARNRLAKILTQKNSKLIKTMKGQGVDSSSIDLLLRENAEMAKFVSDNFAYIIRDLKQNMRYRIILDPEDIPKFTSNARTLAHADLASKEIVFFLPNFESVISKPSELIDALTNTIRHETWHIIDSRLASIFANLEGRLLSELDDLSDAFKIITENLNSSVLSKEYAAYMTHPAELFVRIKELRRFIGKNTLTAEDLKRFSVKNTSSIPLDLKPLHSMMQKTSDWRVTYKSLADAMNQVL